MNIFHLFVNLPNLVYLYNYFLQCNYYYWIILPDSTSNAHIIIFNYYPLNSIWFIVNFYNHQCFYRIHQSHNTPNSKLWAWNVVSHHMPPILQKGVTSNSFTFPSPGPSIIAWPLCPASTPLVIFICFPEFPMPQLPFSLYMSCRWFLQKCKLYFQD